MAAAPADFVLQSKELIARRQYQEAVKVCRLGLLQHPGVVEGRIVLGQALMALGRHDEVLGEMRVAIEADPTSGTAYLLKGEALYLKGDYLEAEEALVAARGLGPDEQRAKLLLAEIASARRDGMLPDRTSEGPGTKEYPAFRSFREMAVQAPGGDEGGYPPLGPASPSDFEEPDSTVVDDAPPQSVTVVPVVSLVPPGARPAPSPAAPAWPEPRHDPPTTPWDPDAPEEPTSPQTMLPPAPVRPSAGLSRDPDRPTPFDMGQRPVSASGSIDARTGMPLTETGSIQLGEGDLVLDEDVEQVEEVDDALDGIEPDEPPGPTVAARPSARQSPPEGPAAPAAPAAHQPALSPLQIIAAADPGESPVWGAARSVSPPRREEPDDDLGEPTVPARHRAPASPVPRLAPAGAPPASEGPPWAARRAAPQPTTPRPTTPQPAAPRHGAPQSPPTASISPWGGDDEGDNATTRARPSPQRTPPPPSWRDRLEAHLGEGRARVHRLAALGAAALLFLVAISLVGSALRSRHRAQSQRAVAWRQVATGNYPGYRIALRAFEQASIDRPRDARALAARAFTAASLTLELGEPSGPAKEAVAAASARAATQPDLVAAEGYLALATGDLPGASLRARALTEQQPKDPRGPYLEARVRLEEGAYPAAVPLLAEALKRDPRHLPALRALGLAHAASYRAADARAAWQRALALNPIHVAALLDEALFATKQREGLPAAEATLVSIVSGKLKAYASPAQIAWGHLALGRLALARGDGSHAATALAKAAAMRPERDPHFAAELCGAYLWAGDSAHAREELRRFPALPRPLVALRRGALAVLEGQAETGLAELRTAPAGDPETRLWRGRALISMGKLDEASRELQAAASAAPRRLAPRLELARLAIAKGHAGTAYASLARLNEEEPGNAYVLEALGESLLARGDRNVARLRFLEAAKRSPGLAGARLHLAQILKLDGKWQQARAHLEGALAARPELLAARRELAQVLYDLGDGPAAKREWEAVLRRHPDAATAIAAARAAALAHDPEAANRLADRAQQLGRGRALPLREWGRAHLVRREPAKALQKLRPALRLDPRDVEAAMLYVDALIDSGEGETARKELPQLIKRFPRALEVGITRGRLEVESGQASEALSILEPTCARAKERRAPPRRLAECLTLAGRAYFIQSDLKRAAESLAQARTADPRNSQAHYFGGVVAAELDRQQDAVQLFERAVVVNPKFAEAWYRLAEARQKRKAAGAATAYREYLKLAPAGVYAADARERLQTLESASRPASPSRR